MLTKPLRIDIPADEALEESGHAIKKIEPADTFNSKAPLTGGSANGERIELAYRFYADTD